MPLVDFKSVADSLAVAWKSSVVGQETHDYNEGLLVVDGKLLLQVEHEAVTVEAGQMYLAPAGVPHAVLPGSHGTLVIIDV